MSAKRLQQKCKKMKTVLLFKINKHCTLTAGMFLTSWAQNCEKYWANVMSLYSLITLLNIIHVTDCCHLFMARKDHHNLDKTRKVEYIDWCLQWIDVRIIKKLNFLKQFLVLELMYSLCASKANCYLLSTVKLWSLVSIVHFLRMIHSSMRKT